MQDQREHISVNHEILHEAALRYPRVIKDYDNLVISKPTTWETFLNACTVQTRWKQWNKLNSALGISSLLRGLDFEYPIIEAMPEVTSASRNVLVVTRPRLNFPVTTGHWSIFCQGRFYHLTAPGLVNNTANDVTLGPGASNVPVVLKIEDFSSPDAPDFQDFNDHRQALIAYHVGMTAYPPEIIETISNWIIGELHTYDLLSRNCQIFVASLLLRIVMTSWDGSVFVGDKLQIAEWDSKRNDPSRHFYTRESGYVIRKPLETPATVRHSGLLTHFRMGNHHYASGIRELYRGKLAFDPTGKHGRITYTGLEVINRFRELGSVIPKNGPPLSRALKEFGKDISKGKLREAFVGRLDTRLEYWDVIKKEIEDGLYAEASMYVAFQRWVLSIPPEYS